MGQLEVLEAPARIAWRPGRDLTEALILQDSTATILSSEGPSSGSIGFVATSRADLRLLLDDFLSRSDLRLPVRFTIPELVGFLNLEPGFRVLHAGPETCFVADPRRRSSRSASISRDHVDIGLVV